MLQSSVLMEDQDPIPQSTFRPLLQDLKTADLPLIQMHFTRCKDMKKVGLKVFSDGIVGACGEEKSFMQLEDDIFFCYCLEERKIWFQNRENGAFESFRAQNCQDLQNFVSHLKKRCSQSNFSSRYQLLEQKGKGKNSIVYEARRKTDQVTFAVKIQNYTSDLSKEISVLRELHHPNIIYFHEYFIEDYQVYIVMEYEDGGSLLDLIKKNEPLCSKRKLKIFMDLLNGLEYLRIKGIVHRDLKPENILFSTQDRNYKIADFGLSKMVGEKLQKVAGTPGYMAPELLRENNKNQVADIKSDIYSMGLIFYEILTFHQYYQGGNTEQILKKNMEKTSLKKKKKCQQLMTKLQYQMLQKMIRSQSNKRKNSYEILQSALFSKINKLYGIELLTSTTTPSKKVWSKDEENQQIEGFVGSFWNFIRTKSWSS